MIDTKQDSINKNGFALAVTLPSLVVLIVLYWATFGITKITMKFSSFAFVGLLILKINLVGGYQAFVLSVGETNLSDGFSKSFPNLSDNIKHILISHRKMGLGEIQSSPNR